MRTNTLLELFLVARTLFQPRASAPILPKIGAIIVLSIVTGLLATGIAAALFYAAYLAFTMCGMSALSALLFTIAIALAALLACVIALRCTACKMKCSKANQTDGIGSIVEAFLDGLSKK